MLLAYARHFRGPVEDRHKVWVEAGAAAYIAFLPEDEEAGAEALGARAGMCFYVAGSDEWRRSLGVIPSEEIEEGIWFRHCGVHVGELFGLGLWVGGGESRRREGWDE